MLTYVGCPVYGNEAALVVGDDIAFRSGTYHERWLSRWGGSGQLGWGVDGYLVERDAPPPTSSRGRTIVV